jgi:diguanylate cyclase (GGDEF)-like protein
MDDRACQEFVRPLISGVMAIDQPVSHEDKPTGPFARGQLNTPELLEEFEKKVRLPLFRSSRVYALTGLIGSLIFIWADYHYLNEQFTYLAMVRGLLVAVCLVMLYISHYTSMRVSFLLNSFGLCLFNALIVYFGIVAANTGNAGTDIYQQGTILIILYACTLYQAPVKYTMVLCGFCWLSYVVGISVFTDTRFEILLNNALVFGMAGVLGIMAVMQRERYVIDNFLQKKQLKKQQARASQQALTDALTQLPNRYSLMRELEAYQGQVPVNMLVMMLDVDNFKQLNDTLGHNIGDQALKAISEKLALVNKEEQGFLARYGGEEFIMFMEGLSSTRIQHITKRILTEINTMKVEGLPAITLSIGAYITKGEDNSIGECIELADHALLEAKQLGKNRVHFH